MNPPNLERMLQLVNEFFDVRNDPDQLAVTDDVVQRLQRIHPSTMTEEKNSDGPTAWVLVIPTTGAVMDRFIRKEINERMLLDETPLPGTYDTVYLCSAMVLPEYRGKGAARRLACQAITDIRRGHPIASLFAWPFSDAGRKLARSIAAQVHLPLYERPA